MAYNIIKIKTASILKFYIIPSFFSLLENINIISVKTKITMTF